MSVASPTAMRKRPLKIGLHLSIADRWEDILAMAKRAASVGFDSLWMGDHLHMKREQLWITAGRPVPHEVAIAPPVGAWECW